MAVGKYKAVKPFDHEGTAIGIGMILILETEDAKPLVETGKVIHQKYLDPEDPSDKREIEHFKDNPAGKRKRPQPAPVEESTEEAEEVADESESEEADVDEETEDEESEEESADESDESESKDEPEGEDKPDKPAKTAKGKSSRSKK